MAVTLITTYHLGCDSCHADGGTEEFTPTPDGWRRLGSVELCPACTDRLTVREFLALRDSLNSRELAPAGT